MEANFSVMATIPICQDLELLMAPFLIMNSQLTLTHQLEWDCKCPYFQEEQFISCSKIPTLIENKRVRAKIPCGFKVKGSGQLAEFALVCEWKLNNSLTANKVCSNTLVSQNDVSNNIEWQIGLKQQLSMLST